MEKGTALGRIRIAEQLADRLRAGLGSGRWAAGEKLPSELALAREFGAVLEAVREGLLDVRHGSGTFAMDSSAVENGAPRGHAAPGAQHRGLRGTQGLGVEAVRLAALRADRAGLRVVDDLLHGRQEPVGMNTTEFVDADLRFTGPSSHCPETICCASFLTNFTVRYARRSSTLSTVSRNCRTPAANTPNGSPPRTRAMLSAVAATTGHFDPTITRLLGR